MNTDETTEEQQKKCRYAKELLRKIATCFDIPVWGSCTGEDADTQCLMPNYRHTPDSVVAIIPENSVVDLRYPIFITEVLDQKELKGNNEEKYNGFNAAMQSLVFAPHAYYCEVVVGDTKMYIIKKVPHKGYLEVEAKHYRLYDEDNFNQFLQDICAALINSMVNLSPIAQYSAKCLKKADTRISSTSRVCIRRPSNPTVGISLSQNIWGMLGDKIQKQTEIGRRG